MPITPRFDLNDKRNELRMALLRIEQAIIFRLKYLGEQCVNLAREGGLYRNQTGNLRNSIGYVVFSKGDLREENFKMIASGQDPSTVNPVETARTYALRRAAEAAATSDYVLIVVAGMDYASKVEAMGKDVLVSAEQYCEEQLPKMVAQLKANIKATR